MGVPISSQGYSSSQMVGAILQNEMSGYRVLAQSTNISYTSTSTNSRPIYTRGTSNSKLSHNSDHSDELILACTLLNKHILLKNKDTTYMIGTCSV